MGAAGLALGATELLNIPIARGVRYELWCSLFAVSGMRFDDIFRLYVFFNFGRYGRCIKSNVVNHMRSTPCTFDFGAAWVNYFWAHRRIISDW